MTIRSERLLRGRFETIMFRAGWAFFTVAALALAVVATMVVTRLL